MAYRTPEQSSWWYRILPALLILLTPITSRGESQKAELRIGDDNSSGRRRLALRPRRLLEELMVLGRVGGRGRVYKNWA